MASCSTGLWNDRHMAYNLADEYLTYFRARRLMYTAGPGLGIIGLAARSPGAVDFDEVYRALVTTAADTDIDKQAFATKAKAYIVAKKSGKKPTNVLERFVRKYEEDCFQRIASIPASKEKTICYFRTFIDFDRSLTFSLFFKDELKTPSHAAVKPFIDQLATGRLDGISLGRESMSLLEQYRFFDAYAHDFARSLLQEVISYFRDTFVSITTEWGYADTPHESRLEHAAFDLWLVSRANTLSRALGPEIRTLINLLPRWQNSAGWWPVEVWQEQPGQRGNSRAELARVPSAEVTACALVALSKLSDDRHSDQLQRGSQWLAQLQNDDGSWNDKELRGLRSPSLLATVVSSEALRRTGMPADHFQIARAEQWIIEQQHGLGFWEQRPYDPEFISSIILEYFRDIPIYKTIDTSLLKLSRELFRKAEELVAEGGSASRRLGIISAFHSVELFLYGVFADPNYNINYFKERSGDTIGLRDALASLEVYLKEKRGPATRLKWRQQMSDLASRRDQIVHKGHDIDASTASELMKMTRSFLSHYGHEFLAIDLTT
jgi:hypothetical protein